MRYDDDDELSQNVEDRRSRRGGGGLFPFPMGRGRGRGGGGFRIPVGRRGGRGGGFSIITLLIIGAVMWMMGLNPFSLLTGGGGSGAGIPQFPQTPNFERQAQRDNGTFRLPTNADRAPKSADAKKLFMQRVLRDTERVWTKIFKTLGRRYQEPKLVLFTGATRSACGVGQAAMGPFYCPADGTIYIDLSFYDELERRFRAPGDFAQAYVVAHEVGHHVQNLFGIIPRVQQMKSRMSKREANRLQVKMELQADCLAGLWARLAHQAENRLEPGDIEEGLRAASAVGDDMIQRQTTGRVVPEAFTHGSAEQRVRWFRRGLESGKLQACDTFNASKL
ncbi:MAG: neutral zinc metallopeptidase [Pseudomonadota bacterium]